MDDFLVFGYSGAGLGASTHRFKVRAKNRTEAKRRVRNSTLGIAWDGEPITRLAAMEWEDYHEHFKYRDVTPRG